jgi:hypothetical protein
MSAKNVIELEVSLGRPTRRAQRTGSKQPSTEQEHQRTRRPYQEQRRAIRDPCPLYYFPNPSSVRPAQVPRSLSSNPCCAKRLMPILLSLCRLSPILEVAKGCSDWRWEVFFSKRPPSPRPAGRSLRETWPAATAGAEVRRGETPRAPPRSLRQTWPAATAGAEVKREETPRASPRREMGSAPPVRAPRWQEQAVRGDD